MGNAQNEVADFSYDTASGAAHDAAGLPARVSVFADNVRTRSQIAHDLDGAGFQSVEGGVIAEGTIVASHYVFFDSIDGIQAGYVDFDADILGIAALPNSMGATDFLANTAVTYIGTELRGLEEGDYVWIDPEDPHRLWVYWAGSSPGDYIRVFTKKSKTAEMM